jgi:hypothetical protein
MVRSGTLIERMQDHKWSTCGILLIIQDYWVFGLWPSSGILKKREEQKNTFQKLDVSILR